MAERTTTSQTTPVDRLALVRNRVSDTSRTNYRRTTAFIKRRPMTSFLIMLGLLLLILIVGKLLQPAPAEKAEQHPVKQVSLYTIGKGPEAAFQAKIEKSGVVQIVAQAPGIVSSIPVKEGQTIGRGQLIVSLSNNYQGGNASSVQHKIAQKQYQNVLDTYGLQLDLISKQKDVATTSAQSAQQTRDIAQQSLGETSDLINANQTQLDQMRAQLTTLITNNPNPDATTATQISTLQGSINQLQSGVNQLREAQRGTEQQAKNDKAPALLSNLQKDISAKQLDVQQKGLDLSKDVTRLQANLAAINESLMYPVSPFSGTVEKINVKEGDSVSAGTVLATITSDDVKTTAILLVPQNVAQVVGKGSPSKLMIQGKAVDVTPTYISSEATDGQLYSIFYDVPTDVQDKVSNGDYIPVNVPIGTAEASAAPLIPIDAVYQTQENTYVLVTDHDKAKTRVVTPGNVYGSYVEIKNGLQNGDRIILDRNVIAEDKVTIK